MGQPGQSLAPTLITIVVLVAIVAGVVRALRWLGRKALWAFGWTRGAAKTIALALCFLLLVLAIFSLLEMLLRQFGRVVRRRQEKRSCPLPRYASVAAGHSQVSSLDEKAARLFIELARQLYGIDARTLSEAEFLVMKTRLGPLLWGDEGMRLWMRTHVVGGLYARLMEGDASVSGMLEKVGQGHRQRKAFWILRRLAHLLSRGLVGLSPAEVFHTHDPGALRGDPQALERFVYEHLTGITFFEGVLGKELAPRDPGAAAIGGRPPGPARTEERSPIAEGPPPAIRQLPPASEPVLEAEYEEVAIGSHEAGTGRREAAEADVETLCDLLGDPDAELWDDPGTHLPAARQRLALASANHPRPDLVMEVVAEVRTYEARLPGFMPWWQAQMALEDEGRWSPLLTQELAELESVSPGELAPTLRRRCCFAYLRTEDPAKLNAPPVAGETDGVAAAAPSPFEASDPTRASEPDPERGAPERRRKSGALASSKGSDPAGRGDVLSFFPERPTDLPAQFGL